MVLALSSALTAIWLLAIPGHWLPVGSETSAVVLLVGMAVGVDYSLFFLRRRREERASGSDSRQAIAAAFPQSPAPAEVAVTGQHLTGPAVTGAISSLDKLAAERGGPVREPVTASVVAGGRALIVSVPLAGNGGDAASYSALDTLRDRILPETLGKAGVSYAVTSDTADNHDDASQLSARTPLVLAVVAAVAFCLLLLAFRSVVLPLVSIALNFLSVAAAYGLITFIFQDGRLQGRLGYASSGAITPWVPLFLFTFLFGISMDYHVFILSRIRELRRRGETTPRAITAGIASSAGVVTRGVVAAGRGVVLFGFTLASLVLWAVLLIVVALIPLGVGLPLTAATLRAIRGLEARAWWHIADWCGFAAAAPRPAGPAGREGGMPSFWVRFGSLMADPDTWRSLVWSSVDILAGWLLTLAPVGLIAWGLFGVVMPAVWHPVVTAHGNNWYAFIHVTTASTAWLSAALGIAFIALGLMTAPWFLRRYAALARSLQKTALSNQNQPPERVLVPRGPAA